MTTHLEIGALYILDPEHPEADRDNDCALVFISGVDIDDSGRVVAVEYEGSARDATSDFDEIDVAGKLPVADFVKRAELLETYSEVEAADAEEFGEDDEDDEDDDEDDCEDDEDDY